MTSARYAVVVRAANELFLFREIKRKATTDIYVCWPIKKFLLYDNPHASYHKSGQVHVKTSRNSKALPPVQRQKPDQYLKGTEGILLTPIDTRELKTPCVPSKYDSVFEIPIADISPSRHTGAYQVHFALTEPGVSVPLPDLPGPPALISQHIFRDNAPWLVVTLFKVDQ